MTTSLVFGTDADPGGPIDNIRTLDMMAGAYYLIRGALEARNRSETRHLEKNKKFELSG